MTYKCSLISHWCNEYDGWRVRASALIEGEMPFVPYVGMTLSVVAEEAALEVVEVTWCLDERTLTISGVCDLAWPRDRFDSLVARLREGGYDIMVYENE